MSDPKDPYHDAAFAGALGGMFAQQASLSTNQESVLPYNGPIVAANAFAFCIFNNIGEPEGSVAPATADLLRKLCQAWWRNRNPNAMTEPVYSNSESYTDIVLGILTIFNIANADLV